MNWKFWKNGCSGHHLKVKYHENEWKTEKGPKLPHPLKIKVYRKVEKVCIHDGCSAREEGWKLVNSFESHRLQKILENGEEVLEWMEGPE